MVGQGGTNEGHHHQGREIRDAELQSGFAFPVSAESESAANERTAAAAFPARNAAAATLHQAGADTVPAANIPTGQANFSAGPDPSARSDPAKSNSGSADAKRAAPGRGRGIVSRYCPQSSSEVSGIRSGPAEYKSYLVGFFCPGKR